MPPSCLISPFSFKAKPFEDLPTLALSISSALVLTASSNQASASPILLIKVIYYLYTAKARDQFSGLALLYFTAASDTGNHFSPKVFFFSQILHHHTHLVSLCLWRFLTPSADSPTPHHPFDEGSALGFLFFTDTCTLEELTPFHSFPCSLYIDEENSPSVFSPGCFSKLQTIHSIADSKAAHECPISNIVWPKTELLTLSLYILRHSSAY